MDVPANRVQFGVLSTNPLVIGIPSIGGFVPLMFRLIGAFLVFLLVRFVVSLKPW
jgi:hypothetical protein